MARKYLKKAMKRTRSSVRLSTTKEPCSDPRECNICLLACEEDAFKACANSHFFHAECLRKWICTSEEANTCPTCRAPLSTATIRELLGTKDLLRKEFLSAISIDFNDWNVATAREVTRILFAGTYGKGLLDLAFEVYKPSALCRLESSQFDQVAMSICITQNGIEYMEFPMVGSILHGVRPIGEFTIPPSLSLLDMVAPDMVSLIRMLLSDASGGIVFTHRPFQQLLGRMRKRGVITMTEMIQVRLAGALALVGLVAYSMRIRNSNIENAMTSEYTFSDEEADQLLTAGTNELSNILISTTCFGHNLYYDVIKPMYSVLYDVTLQLGGESGNSLQKWPEGAHIYHPIWNGDATGRAIVPMLQDALRRHPDGKRSMPEQQVLQEAEALQASHVTFAREVVKLGHLAMDQRPDEDRKRAAPYMLENLDSLQNFTEELDKIKTCRGVREWRNMQRRWGDRNAEWHAVTRVMKAVQRGVDCESAFLEVFPENGNPSAPEAML